jgi:hypothetical protein
MKRRGFIDDRSVYRRRDFLIGSLLLPTNSAKATAAIAKAAGTNTSTAPPAAAIHLPKAVAGSSWSRKANWDFGTSLGNNVRKLSDFLGSGWAADNGSWGIETAAKLTRNDDPHFQVQTDHVDLVDIYTGGTAAKNNGSITAPVFNCHVDQFGLGAPGYYEGTFKIPPNPTGMWPGWWMTGWDASAPTWGPEIDIFEFWSDSDKGPGKQFVHLHAPHAPSLCFLPSPGTDEGKQTGLVPVKYIAPGARPTGWADSAASTVYAPGTDFSADFHRFGCKINPDYRIELWTDDVLIETLAARQFCTDKGKPVLPLMIISFAAAAGATTGDFGGINNSSATNKWRMGLKNIQFWGP